MTQLATLTKFSVLEREEPFRREKNCSRVPGTRYPRYPQSSSKASDYYYRCQTDYIEEEKARIEAVFKADVVSEEVKEKLKREIFLKMAENLKKLPKRGILKQSTSFEQRDLEHSHSHKNPHFDEQNLLETLHPADKDYGHMKIDEPNTPFEYARVDEEDEDAEDGGRREELDANLLAAKIAAEAERTPRRFSEPSADEADLRLLSPDEREARRKFEFRRKKHYNEFQAVKMARQLMEEEDDEDDGDGDAKDKASSEAMETS